MSAFDRPFAAQEYANRIARAKQAMSQAGFDLIVCQDPANMGWLTGYDGWSFYVPQCVLVHLDAPHPIWFGRAQDARAAEITTDLPPDQVVHYAEHLVQSRDGHPYDALADLIRARGWGRARIGVEMDAHYYTARCHASLAAGLADARISDNAMLVNWLRLVKSPAELALMREAGRICTAAMNDAIAQMRSGAAQNDVIAEIYRCLVRGVDGLGGDYASICPLMPVGAGTSTPHLTWTDAPLPQSALAMLEIAGVRRRYHAPLTRTMHFGPAPQKLRDVAKVVVEGVDAALREARPGRSCEDVEAAWQAVLRRNGLSKDSRVGYPIGLSYPPDWGEATCSLRPGDRTELQEGMCFHIQSGIWRDEWGVAISESFVVTEQGGDRLCDVTRDLIELA